LSERNLKVGLVVFYEYSYGGAYWTWKFSGNATVDRQGTQADYWNYEGFVDRGYSS
jgi:hypothetical protein